MKKLRKILALVVIAVLLLSLQTSNSVHAVFTENSEKEEKTYCNATLANDFADNRILVVLSNEASLNYLQSETIDFPELKEASVKSFTCPRGKQIKAMVDERKI